MKKLLAGLLAVTMLFALTACVEKEDGGDTSSNTQAHTEAPKEESKLYAGYYSATIPDGFEIADSQEEIRSTKESSKVIKIMISSKTAEAEAERRINMDKDRYKKGEDVTVGAYTYKTVDFEWNGGTPSKMLFLDAPGAEGKCVQIDLFMMTPEDKDAKAFLESLKIEDDAYNKRQEFKSKK